MPPLNQHYLILDKDNIQLMLNLTIQVLFRVLVSSTQFNRLLPTVQTTTI